MNATMTDALTLEHQLRVKRADRLGPLLFDRDLQMRRTPRPLALRGRIGRALVAIGTWLQGIPSVTAAPAQG
jgi:hypothetical protein